MEIGGFWIAEQVLQEDLARRRSEQVGSADDLGDPLFGIVDDDGKLVGEDSVGALQHEIADLLLDVLALPALQQILEAERLRVGAHAPSAGASTFRQA